MPRFAHRMPVVILLTSLILTGCHYSGRPTGPLPPASPEQRECQKRCADLQQYCLHQREKIYQQCRHLASQQAHLNYDAYYRDQLARHKKPNQLRKSPQDFYDVRHCEHQLDCAGEDKLCQHSCG